MLLLSIAILILALLGYWFISQEKEVPKYGLALDGTTISLNYFNAPVKSKEDVYEWASTVSSSALSLNFNQYKSQLAKVKQFFTEDGWKKFQESLKDSGYLDEVKNNKLLITAINNKTPTIPRWGYLNGEIYWSVQVPLKLSIQSASQTVKKDRMVTMLIKLRTPKIPNDGGCGYQEVLNYLSDNLTILQMYQKGCGIRAFRSAGITDEQLLKAGYTNQQLRTNEGNGLNPLVVDSFYAY